MIGTEPMIGVAVSTHGPVEGNEVAYARDKLAHLFRVAGHPILRASVRLVAETNPSHEERAVAEATLDLDGRVARAHVVALSMHEAVDLLEARLRRRLLMLEERQWQRRRPHHERERWHHTEPMSHRPHFRERPIDEREVVRRKSFSIDACTPDEAAFEMELLAHDFYLFTNVENGAATVVYRRTSSGYGLIESPGCVSDLSRCSAPISPSERVAITLTVDEAREYLDLVDERFVFFIDSETSRGAILYRRYDGHYGLVTRSVSLVRVAGFEGGASASERG